MKGAGGSGGRVIFDRLASHSGESGNTPSHFMLFNRDKLGDRMQPLARIQTYPISPHDGNEISLIGYPYLSPILVAWNGYYYFYFPLDWMHPTVYWYPFILPGGEGRGERNVIQENIAQWHNPRLNWISVDQDSKVLTAEVTALRRKEINHNWREMFGKDTRQK